MFIFFMAYQIRDLLSCFTNENQRSYVGLKVHRCGPLQPVFEKIYYSCSNLRPIRVALYI